MKHRNYLIHNKVVISNKLISILKKKLKIKHCSKDDSAGNISVNLKHPLSVEQVK